MGNQYRNQNKYQMLSAFFDDFLFVPRRLVELSLLIGISFNPIFYFTENHFHKQCLWTCPATPYPAKHNRKEYDKNKKSDHGYT